MTVVYASGYECALSIHTVYTEHSSPSVMRFCVPACGYPHASHMHITHNYIACPTTRHICVGPLVMDAELIYRGTDSIQTSQCLALAHTAPICFRCLAAMQPPPPCVRHIFAFPPPHADSGELSRVPAFAPGSAYLRAACR